jgi:4-hydroxy-2-oxoheptanedioate aldolase
MIKLDFRERLKKDGPLLGMQCFTGNAAIVEILGGAGYDWVSLDMEHAPSDFALVEQLTRAANFAGITPLVRVADNDPVLIMKALDTGAAGVFIPHASSRADVERAVEASLYAPQGSRGACSATRPAGYGAERWNDYIKRANENVVVIPLIEDQAGIDAFDDLLRIEQVPAYWLGVTDLTVAIGCPGADFFHPQLAALARDMNKRVAAAGKALMVTVTPNVTVEYALHLVSLGFRLISFAVDLRVFLRAVTDIAIRFRSGR